MSTIEWVGTEEEALSFPRAPQLHRLKNVINGVDGAAAKAEAHPDVMLVISGLGAEGSKAFAESYASGRLTGHLGAVFTAQDPVAACSQVPDPIGEVLQKFSPEQLEAFARIWSEEGRACISHAPVAEL